MSDDHAMAEAARAYVARRLDLGSGAEDQMTMIARLDAAWADLVDCYDQENPL